MLLEYAHDTLRFWRSRLKAAGYNPARPVTPESLREISLLSCADVPSCFTKTI
jgi:hypothetical protein